MLARLILLLLCVSVGGFAVAWFCIMLSVGCLLRFYKNLKCPRNESNNSRYNALYGIWRNWTKQTNKHETTKLKPTVTECDEIMWRYLAVFKLGDELKKVLRHSKIIFIKTRNFNLEEETPSSNRSNQMKENILKIWIFSKLEAPSWMMLLPILKSSLVQ